MTKSDLQLKLDIETELRWDPTVNAAQVAVSVDQGVVTLLGSVDTHAARWAAENATRRVGGVRSVVQDLTVKIRDDHERSDTEIAAAVLAALTWNVLVPATVTARVERGAITLEGHVRWNFQREAAELSVRYLKGVRAVFDDIKLDVKPSAAQVKEQVEAALRRQALVDASAIHAEASGGKVTLTGHASSWRALTNAENAAWAAPGVTEVVDNVTMSTDL